MLLFWGVLRSLHLAGPWSRSIRYVDGRGPDHLGPTGYALREDADLLVLAGPDGSVVAAFSALGFDPQEVIAAAREDHE